MADVYRLPNFTRRALTDAGWSDHTKEGCECWELVREGSTVAEIAVVPGGYPSLWVRGQQTRPVLPGYLLTELRHAGLLGGKEDTP